MRAAFGIAVADIGTTLPEHVRAVLASEQPPDGVPFVAAEHVSVDTAAGRTAVGVWQEPIAVDVGVVWDLSERQLAVVIGEIRRKGCSWRAQQDWPHVLADVVDQGTLKAELLDELMGMFSGLVITGDEAGAIVADPLGFRFIYVARGATWTVISSNAHVAAWLAAPPRSTPVRDPMSVVGLAYSRHRITNQSGYVGVEALRPGAYVVLHSDRNPEIVERGSVWLPGDDLRALPRAELLDFAHAALEENLRAALTFPADLFLADLTGGMDSRLILALMVTAGIKDEFTFRTDGPAGLPDVEVARELAAMLDLRWVHGTDIRKYLRDQGCQLNVPDPNLSYAEGVRGYVQDTAGMDNLWQAKSVLHEWRGLYRVGGVFGEQLRSNLHAEFPSREHLVNHFSRYYGHLGLALPATIEHYTRLWQEQVFDDPSGRASLNDLHDAYNMNFRTRRTFGPREERVRTPRLLGLYVLDAVRAAYALGAPARIAAALHDEFMTRADPRIRSHRVVGKGWWDVEPPPPVKPPRGRRTLHRARKTQVDVTNLGQHRRKVSGSAERVELLRTIQADRSNAIWNHVDRNRFDDAVDNYDGLTTAEALELSGAATAAIWLADDTAQRVREPPVRQQRWVSLRVTPGGGV